MPDPGPRPHVDRGRSTVALSGCRFQLLRATCLAVFGDLRLRHVLVLGADHPEHGRRRVLAAGHGAELARELAAATDTGPGSHVSAVTATQAAPEQVARPFQGLLFDDDGELACKFFDQRPNIVHAGNIEHFPLTCNAGAEGTWGRTRRLCSRLPRHHCRGPRPSGCAPNPSIPGGLNLRLRVPTERSRARRQAPTRSTSRARH